MHAWFPIVERLPWISEYQHLQHARRPKYRAMPDRERYRSGAVQPAVRYLAVAIVVHRHDAVNLLLQGHTREAAPRAQHDALLGAVLQPPGGKAQEGMALGSVPHASTQELAGDKKGR